MGAQAFPFETFLSYSGIVVFPCAVLAAAVYVFVSQRRDPDPPLGAVAVVFSVASVCHAVSSGAAAVGLVILAAANAAWARRLAALGCLKRAWIETTCLRSWSKRASSLMCEHTPPIAPMAWLEHRQP